jgi:phage major head subunit gpT-like protein
MGLNVAQAEAVVRDVTQVFDTAVRTATPIYPELCTVVNSNRKDEKLGFLGSVGGIREFLGERQFATLRAADYTLANKHWEGSVRIEKNDLSDDVHGLLAPVMEDLGAEAAYHPDELLFTVLQAGASSACMDGSNMFDTTHQWGDSGSQSNRYQFQVVSATAPTAIEFRSAYHYALMQLTSLKRDNGKPFIRPVVGPLGNLILCVPTGLREASTAAMKSIVINQSTNVVLEDAKVLPCTFLTDQTKFWLLYTGGALKPFVFQAREPITRQFKGLEDFEEKYVKWMSSARYNCGYLAWWFAIQVTLSTGATGSV